MEASLKCLLVASVFINVICGEEKCPPSELPSRPVAKLRQTLLCGYDSTSRPVKNVNTTVSVTISLTILRIQMTGEKMYVSAIIVIRWHDEFMVWDKSKYAGISYLRIDNKELWMPDLSVNLMMQNGIEELPIKTCSVTDEGDVSCIENLNLNLACDGNVRLWPYDAHLCSFSLSSYMYYEHELNLTTADLWIRDKNKGWDVLSYSVDRKIFNYSEYNFLYPRQVFQVSIRRHASAYEAATVLPSCVLLTVMLSTFWLGKIMQCRVIICGFLLFISGFSGIYLLYLVPQNGSNTPTIIIIYRDCMALSAFSLIMAMLVKTLNASTDNPPAWMLSVTDKLDTISFARKLVSTSTSSSVKDDEAAIIENNAKPNLWEPITVLLDRLAFLSALIVTIILLFGYMP